MEFHEFGILPMCTRRSNARAVVHSAFNVRNFCKTKVNQLKHLETVNGITPLNVAHLGAVVSWSDVICLTNATTCLYWRVYMGLREGTYIACSRVGLPDCANQCFGFKKAARCTHHSHVVHLPDRGQLRCLYSQCHIDVQYLVVNSDVATPPDAALKTLTYVHDTWVKSQANGLRYARDKAKRRALAEDERQVFVARKVLRQKNENRLRDQVPRRELPHYVEVLYGVQYYDNSVFKCQVRPSVSSGAPKI